MISSRSIQRSLRLILAAAALVAAGNWSMGTSATAQDALLDSSQEARAQSGEHQFYIWCTGADDFTVTETGENADAAQETVFASLRAEGKSTCWPIWQGKR